MHPPGPRYSLAYLHFLARKHQARQHKSAPDTMNVDSDADPDDTQPRKKPRKSAPTMSERIGTALAEAGVHLDPALGREPATQT